MAKFYVASERGKYQEVNAESITDLNAWMIRKYGKVKPFAESRRDPIIQGRKFGGLSEVPVGFGEVK